MDKTYPFFVPYKRKPSDILRDVKQQTIAHSNGLAPPLTQRQRRESWMEETLKGGWTFEIYDGYFFELEHDAVAFKLRWVE